MRESRAGGHREREIKAEEPWEEGCRRGGRKAASRRQGEGVQRLGAGSSRVLSTKSHHPCGEPPSSLGTEGKV